MWKVGLEEPRLPFIYRFNERDRFDIKELNYE